MCLLLLAIGGGYVGCHSPPDVGDQIYLGGGVAALVFVVLVIMLLRAKYPGRAVGPAPDTSAGDQGLAIRGFSPTGSTVLPCAPLMTIAAPR